jgi:hypothetical protein
MNINYHLLFKQIYHNPSVMAFVNTEKRWAQRTPLKITLNPDVREKLAVPTSYTVTNIDNSCTNLLSDRGTKKIYVEGKKF